MKKIVTILMATLLCVCSLMIVGCSNVAGTYKFKSLSSSDGGIEINVEVGEKYNGVTITEDFVVLELHDDGTCKLTAYNQTLTGVWTIEGNKITVTTDGDDSIFVKKGRKLTMVEDGTTIVLSK